MSVLQPISYGLVHQIGPGTGARGFGSYKADNTETIRPYQQESSSPIGRAYPMGIVSGRPTVFDPRAGMREDPVVMLLKELLGKKSPVQKAPDAGFKNNMSVFTTSGQPLEPPGRTLATEPAETGMGGGGGGDMVVKSEMYPEINVKQEFDRLYEAMGRTNQNERSTLGMLASGLASSIASGATSAAFSAASDIVTRTTGAFNSANIPMTGNLAFDVIARQILPEASAETAIRLSRGITDLIVAGERGISDYLYRPIQSQANEGSRILYNFAFSEPATTIPDLPTATINNIPVELLNSARTQFRNYGEVAPDTIAQIVSRIQTSGVQLSVMSLNAVALMTLATLNPTGYMRIQGGRLRNIQRVNYQGM